MAYPAAVESFTTKTDNVDTIEASHVNALQTSIVNIETELGTTPSGAYTDVSDRLDAIDTAVGQAWVADTAAWTYATATTFTVTGNRESEFQRGMKLRYKQGGAYEYAYVISAAYSAVTTVTITTGVDYGGGLADAAITDTYYSYQLIAPGFPVKGLDWSGASGLNIQGFSGTPTQTCYFKFIGSTVVMFINVTGTNNAAGITGTLPIAPADTFRAVVRSRNNTTDYDWGEATATSGNTAITFYKNAAEAAWAGANTAAIMNAYITWR